MARCISTGALPTIYVVLSGKSQAPYKGLLQWRPIIFLTSNLATQIFPNFVGHLEENSSDLGILDEKPGHLIYRVTLADEIRVPADSMLVIKVPRQDESFEVQVLHTVERTLVVMSQQPLPRQMAMVRVEFDPTFILKKLDELLTKCSGFHRAH